MPIKLTPFDDGQLCHGSSWQIADETLLVDRVARIALGQARHVAKVLAGAHLDDPPTPATIAKSAIDLLSVGKTPYNRDGWLFQAMSWIAASLANPHAMIRPPHMIQAHKGFDGLLLELDPANEVVRAAIIFEDKATENPAKTVKEKIWPDFSDLEQGGRENVLAAEASLLLSVGGTGVDADKAIETIVWKNVRRYRISITVTKASLDKDDRAFLFGGYDKIVAGDPKRRRVETLYVEKLREWMDAVAEKAKLRVKELTGV